MDLIQIAVILSTLLCSLVAGLVLTFAIVVMPGFRSLGDRGYLQAFKAVDGVIQNNQPIFILVWAGSALVLLISTVMGFWHLQGTDRVLLIAACAIYILGVQIPTATINVPLNNRLKSLDLDLVDQSTVRELKGEFESRWIRWNTIRTYLSVLTTVLLLVLLLRM